MHYHIILSLSTWVYAGIPGVSFTPKSRENPVFTAENAKYNITTFTTFVLLTLRSVGLQIRPSGAKMLFVGLHML